MVTFAEADLSELFGRCGGLSRLVLPPTRTLALVEYLEPQDARSAFRTLAYKKFNHVPLYLEWAPAGIFTAEAPTLDANGPLSAAAGAKAANRAAEKAARAERKAAAAAAADAAAAATAAAADVTAGDAVDDGSADNETPTIFVKNLAFATSDASLKKHFDKAASAVGGRLAAAKVARRKGEDGKLLSAGYGFVECDSEATAKLVVKKLQVGSTSVMRGCLSFYTTVVACTVIDTVVELLTAYCFFVVMPVLFVPFSMQPGQEWGLRLARWKPLSKDSSLPLHKCASFACL